MSPISILGLVALTFACVGSKSLERERRFMTDSFYHGHHAISGIHEPHYKPKDKDTAVTLGNQLIDKLTYLTDAEDAISGQAYDYRISSLFAQMDVTADLWKTAAFYITKLAEELANPTKNSHKLKYILDKVSNEFYDHAITKEKVQELYDLYPGSMKELVGHLSGAKDALVALRDAAPFVSDDINDTLGTIDQAEEGIKFFLDNYDAFGDALGVRSKK